MGIEWYRDLIICIFGAGATVAVISITVLAFMVYRRTRPIIDSVKSTARTVENLSSTVETQVAGPLSQVAAFVQGVKQAVGLIDRFRKRKEGD